MQSLNFINLAKKYNQLSRLVIIYNMAIDLDGEPALSYAIKYYLLKKVNEINKQIKSEEIKNFIKSLLNILYNDKQKIGRMQDHYKQVEDIIKIEYKALIGEYNSKQFNNELIMNFLKISKLFEVLTIFDCEDQMKQNYLKISKIAQKYAVQVKKALKENQVQPQPQKHVSMLSKVKIKQIPEMMSNNEKHNVHTFEHSTLKIQRSEYDKIFNPFLTEKANFNQRFDNKLNLNDIYDQVNQKDYSLSRIKYKFNKEQIQKQFTQSIFF